MDVGDVDFGTIGNTPQSEADAGNYKEEGKKASLQALASKSPPFLFDTDCHCS